MVSVRRYGRSFLSTEACTAGSLVDRSLPQHWMYCITRAGDAIYPVPGKGAVWSTRQDTTLLPNMVGGVN